MHWQASIRTIDRTAPLYWFTALSSLGAAGVHFAVAQEHFAEYWLFGWFFVVVAWLQALWAMAILASPSRPLALAALVGNLLLIPIWAWTRTIGVPLGPEAGSSEAVALVDGLAVAFEAGVAIGCVLLWRSLAAQRWPPRAVLSIGLASVAAILLIGVSLDIAGTHGHAESSGDSDTAPHHHR